MHDFDRDSSRRLRGVTAIPGDAGTTSSDGVSDPEFDVLPSTTADGVRTGRTLRGVGARSKRSACGGMIGDPLLVGVSSMGCSPETT
jgi:hypothetical protein